MNQLWNFSIQYSKAELYETHLTCLLQFFAPHQADQKPNRHKCFCCIQITLTEQLSWYEAIGHHTFKLDLHKFAVVIHNKPLFVGSPEPIPLLPLLFTVKMRWCKQDVSLGLGLFWCLQPLSMFSWGRHGETQQSYNFKWSCCLSTVFFMELLSHRWNNVTASSLISQLRSFRAMHHIL